MKTSFKKYISLLILLIACSLMIPDTAEAIYLGDTPAPVQGINTRSTKQSKYSVGDTANIAWTFTVGNAQQPVIGADGTIYVLGSSGFSIGHLYAINPDGTQKWDYNFSPDISRSSPCIDDSGNIYFGTMKGSVIAIAPNGTKKWEYNPGSATSHEMYTPLLDSKGNLYVKSANKYLYVLNASSGALLRSIFTDSYDSSVIIDSNDYSYFNLNDSTGYNLVKYSSSGIFQSKININMPVRNALLGQNRSVYAFNGGNAPTESNFFFSFESNHPGVFNYFITYSFDSGHSVTSLALDETNNTIYSKVAQEGIYAYDASTGSEKWHYSDTYYYALDNGELIVDANHVVCTTIGQKIVAINPDGSLKWSLNIPDNRRSYQITHPVIDQNGMLYYVASTGAVGDGFLYAIQTITPKFDVTSPINNSTFRGSERPEFRAKISQIMNVKTTYLEYYNGSEWETVGSYLNTINSASIIITLNETFYKSLPFYKNLRFRFKIDDTASSEIVISKEQSAKLNIYSPINNVRVINENIYFDLELLSDE